MLATGWLIFLVATHENKNTTTFINNKNRKQNLYIYLFESKVEKV